jgi:hypothetical protein
MDFSRPTREALGKPGPTVARWEDFPLFLEVFFVKRGKTEGHIFEALMGGFSGGFNENRREF